MKVLKMLKKKMGAKHIDSTVSERHLERIEKALSYELSEWQREFIKICNASDCRGRITGKTTAYIIALIMSDGPPINIDHIRYYEDQYERALPSIRIESGFGYGSHFKREFLDIHQALVRQGLPVREIVRSTKNEGIREKAQSMDELKWGRGSITF